MKRKNTMAQRWHDAAIAYAEKKTDRDWADLFIGLNNLTGVQRERYKSIVFVVERGLWLKPTRDQQVLICLLLALWAEGEMTTKQELWTGALLVCVVSAIVIGVLRNQRDDATIDRLTVRNDSITAVAAQWEAWYHRQVTRIDTLIVVQRGKTDTVLVTLPPADTQVTTDTLTHTPDTSVCWGLSAFTDWQRKMQDAVFAERRIADQRIQIAESGIAQQRTLLLAAIASSDSALVVARRSLRHWRIGAFAGYGVTLVQGTVRLAPQVGVGITVPLTLRWP